MNDPFADIRPYHDDEVSAVLARLLRDPEFLSAIARLRLGKLASLAPGLWRAVARRMLHRELADVSDVSGIQVVIRSYLTRMLDNTSGGLTVSGLDKLDTGKAHLFMSNHRDITLDPALTNYALDRGGHQTLRIAIGDNLLTKPWVSDLMRLNKSFIVKRSVSGPRELLAASKNLSAYIRHSLQNDNSNVWIAQREGRAKDGVDRTEPAIIKMLSMSRDKKNESFAEHIAGLNIVPVAISYELDPCDARKANELYELAAQGRYEKGEQEDVASIGQGISGQKGRVHVAFGSPITDLVDTPEAVAAELDRQIIANYQLQPTNLYAYEKLGLADQQALPEALQVAPSAVGREEFYARIDAMPVAHREYALRIYANAVVSKLSPPQA